MNIICVWGVLRAPHHLLSPISVFVKDSLFFYVLQKQPLNAKPRTLFRKAQTLEERLYQKSKPLPNIDLFNRFQKYIFFSLSFSKSLDTEKVVSWLLFAKSLAAWVQVSSGHELIAGCGPGGHLPSDWIAPPKHAPPTEWDSDRWSFHHSAGCEADTRCFFSKRMVEKKIGSCL